MTAAPRRDGATYASPRKPVEYQQRERVTVTQALARAMGKSEAWAHARLYRYPRLAEVAVAAIRAYRAAGDLKGLTGFAALMRDALNDAPAPRFTPDLVLSEQTADGAEDVSEVAFLLRPSRETAAAYIRALDQAAAKAATVRAALVAEYEL